MRPVSNVPPESIRAQYAELLNLAATIDEQAQLQHLRGNLRAGLSFITTYALFEAVSATGEDHSDLPSNRGSGSSNLDRSRKRPNCKRPE